MDFMKQSHALAELPKRRFTFGAASYLNGTESWANSPRKVEQTVPWFTVPRDSRHSWKYRTCKVVIGTP